MRKGIVFASLSVGLLCCAAVDPPSPPKEFQARINDYMKVRRGAVQGIPSLKAKAEPEQIEQHQKAVSQAIIQARSGAKAGDVLTPEIRTYLVAIVRAEMKGPEGAPAKKAAKQGNPATETPEVPIPLTVNGIYPEKASVSSVPPTLLMRLPQLPKELDFRFVGRHLILRDAVAGLIIDFVPNAMP